MLTIEKLVMNTQMVDTDYHELDDKYFGQDVYYIKSKLGNSFTCKTRAIINITIMQE